MIRKDVGMKWYRDIAAISITGRKSGKDDGSKEIILRI